MGRNLLLTVVTTLLMLVVSELILRLIPVGDPYQYYKVVPNGYIRSQLPRNLHLQFTIEDSLPGFGAYPKITNFTTDSFGLRSRHQMVMPKPKEELRIFTVGGSTTECVILNDGDEWPALLNQNLDKNFGYGRKIRVFNAGKSGDATIDHIALIAHRLVHFDPDLIIIFPGINDMSRLICDPNPLKFDDFDQEIPLLKYLLTELQIFRRIYALINLERTTLDPTGITLHTSYRKNARLAQSKPVSDSVPSPDYNLYRDNIKTLIGICNSHQIRVMFMTQKTTWATTDPELKKWQYFFNRCGVRFRRRVVQNIMDRLNQILVKISSDYQVPVFRTDTLLENSSTFFYDDCHFNFRGCQEVAQKLTGFIDSEDLIPKLSDPQVSDHNER